MPRMLGSLELLLNPTGLLTSVSAGLEDLLGLPFAALIEASPAQVLGNPPASTMCCLSQGMRYLVHRPHPHYLPLVWVSSQ